MKKTAVVYWSQTGNTEQMAKAVAEGAAQAGAQVSLLTSAQFSADQTGDFDRLAFGCPAAGSEQLDDGEFEPMFDAVKPLLAGKEIALFGSYGWGDGEWMRQWQADCEKAGAVILGGEGLILNEAPDEEGLARCRALGALLAAD